jgi:hypothetical protein
MYDVDGFGIRRLVQDVFLDNGGKTTLVETMYSPPSTRETRRSTQAWWLAPRRRSTVWRSCWRRCQRENRTRSLGLEKKHGDTETTEGSQS